MNFLESPEYDCSFNVMSCVMLMFNLLVFTMRANEKNHLYKTMIPNNFSTKRKVYVTFSMK